jgi:hypothetical protein
MHSIKVNSYESSFKGGSGIFGDFGFYRRPCLSQMRFYIFSKKTGILRFLPPQSKGTV